MTTRAMHQARALTAFAEQLSEASHTFAAESARGRNESRRNRYSNAAMLTKIASGACRDAAEWLVP